MGYICARMRIGLVGGSFNPIHRGHLAIARSARETLGLDRVVLVPSARPPHKRDSTLAPAEDRLAMARLASKDEPGFEVSAIELERTGPSYTIDTVRSFLAASPGAEVHFVIGADSVPELRTWKDARALLGLAKFAVAVRPGYDLTRDLRDLEREFGVRLTMIPTEPDPLSATEIRDRVREGKSIDGLVPAAVRDYIVARNLYREKATKP
jgi:nicotinate-nucleotide adenylyltransferase